MKRVKCASFSFGLAVFLTFFSALFNEPSQRIMVFSVIGVGAILVICRILTRFDKKIAQNALIYFSLPGVLFIVLSIFDVVLYGRIQALTFWFAALVAILASGYTGIYWGERTPAHGKKRSFYTAGRG